MQNSIKRLIVANHIDEAKELICAGLSSKNYQRLVSILKPLGRKQLSELVENELLHCMADDDVDNFVNTLYKTYKDMLPQKYRPIPNKSPAVIPQPSPNPTTNKLPDGMLVPMADSPTDSTRGIQGSVVLSMYNRVQNNLITAGEITPETREMRVQPFFESSNPTTDESMPRNLEGQQDDIMEFIAQQYEKGLTADGIIQLLVSDWKLPEEIALEIIKITDALKNEPTMAERD